MCSDFILNYIDFGSDNAKSRETLVYETGMCDRQVRKAIELAKQEAVIINNGNGYYRPLPSDKYELAAYVKKEEARAKSVLKGLRVARNLLNDYELKRIVEE